eukprot:scaffold16270_cov80-Skeletonema_marinoi.AAC.2
MSDSGSEESVSSKAEKGLPQIQNGEPQTSPAELTQGCSRWLKASYSFLYVETMEFLQPGFLEKPMVGEHSSEKLCSVFLLLWWIFGTGFITFKGPFIFTSNGWFGAWGGLISSCQWCIGLDFVSYDSQSREVKYLMNLVLLSIVTILASISPLREKTRNFEGAGLSIAAGAITLIVCAYLIGMYKEIAKNVTKLTAVLLFVLWVIPACILHHA